MEAAERKPEPDDSTVVDRGLDPDQVRDVIDTLTADLSRSNAKLRLRSTGGSPMSEELLAAEETAAVVRDRAFAAARRTRLRAADDGRDITIHARRHAFEMIRQAREDADLIVGMAQRREADLLARIQALQAVVRRTEALLREVAEGDLGELPSVAARGPAPVGDGISVVVAAEQARVERRLQSVPDRGAEPLPDSVERLLKALRGVDRSTDSEG
jgi:hypothetical protein